MSSVNTTHQITEIYFTSDRLYADPIRDTSFAVEFISPTRLKHRIDGFWDGDHSWLVRFAADEPGEWRYASVCSDPNNLGLHEQRGTFTIEPYDGDNPLYSFGPLRVSDDRYSLVHANGKPFFWLGDTAWNGLLKAKLEDWHQYLSMRRQQGFTVVQAVLTQWRAFDFDEMGETAFSGKEHIQINPAFYQRLDAKVEAITQHELVPALVLIWARTPIDPGHYLSAEDCIVLARYEVAR